MTRARLIRLVLSGLLLGLLLSLSACGDSGSSQEPGDGDTPDGDTPDGDSDGDEPDGDEDGDEPDPEVTCKPGAVSPLEGTSAFFAFGASMFDAPYPNDAFRGREGFIALPGFPNPRNNSLIAQYIKLVEGTLDGFSLNAPVFFRFDAALDLESLPADAAASLEDTSSLMIVNVDPRSPEFGRRTPLEWVFTEEEGSFQPAMLLAVAPMSGFPLLPDTRYAALVTGAARDVNGAQLGRPEALAQILSGCDDSALGDVYHPLLMAQLLDDGIPADIRAATVFTTGTPALELQHIRDYIASEYPEGEIQGEITSCGFSVSESNARVWWFEGRYTSPNLQKGEAPYAKNGGEILFDPDSGQPVVQRMEELVFSLFVPEGDMPESGWPVVMIAHGTGGDYTSGVRSSIRVTLQDAGLAGIGIDQPLHGERGGFLADTLLEMYSFNFLNPGAARSNFRQSSVDTFALTTFLRSGRFVIDRNQCSDWPASTRYKGPDIIRFDPERIYFHGHSHGGLTGAMAAAVEPDVGAWVISGAGGKMALTIMERRDPDILGLVEAMVGVPASELHPHHPLLMLIQTLVDITDPINYAPQWLRYPSDGRARHLMVTTGLKDPYTPRSTAEALAVAAGLPLLEPVAEAVEGLDILGISPFPRPASENVQGPDGHPVTAGFCQYPNAGHFPIFNDQDAIQLYQEFLRSAAYDGIPVLGY